MSSWCSVSSASFSGAATMSSWLVPPIGSSWTRKRVSPLTALTVKGRVVGGRVGRAARREIRLRQRRLARARPDRAPSARSRSGRPRRRRGPGWPLAAIASRAARARPAVLERARDRLGAALRLVVDAVDEEGAKLLVGDDARDDEADRGERDDDGEEARPERHVPVYDSRSA